MATRRQVVQGDPVNIVTTLTLVNGSKYVMENSGSQVIYWSEAADKPDPATVVSLRRLLPYEFRNITVGADGIWVWCPRSFSGVLAVDDEG